IEFLQQLVEPIRGTGHQGGNTNGDYGQNCRGHLAHPHKLLITYIFLDVFFDYINTEQGGNGIEDRIESTQDGPHDDRRKETDQPGGQYLFDQTRVHTVLVPIIGIPKIVKADNPGQNNDQGNQYFKKSGKQKSFLGLFEVFGSQSPLNYRFVHAPKIQLIDNQTSE